MTNIAAAGKQEKSAISEAVKKAVTVGRTLIGEGKSKSEAALAMYETLKAEPRDVVVSAFVDGAGLTPKGAMTYWYNCKRKAEKLARTKA